MPMGMSLPRLFPSLAAACLGAAALLAPALGSLGNAASATASTSAAAGCGGITVTPSTRTARRNGRVLLSGTACAAGQASSGEAPGRVQVRLQKNRRWVPVGSAVAEDSGSFAVCAKIAVSKRARVARLRATGPGGTIGSTSVSISGKGPSGCPVGDSTDDTYEPPPPEHGNPNCPLSHPGAAIGMTLPDSCTQIFTDTASSADPTSLWGRLDCANATRHQQMTSGADPHVTGSGTTQPDGAFRRMSAFDGDDIWGERCEAGLNDQGGPTTLYHEGQRRVTFASIRLPASSPVGNPNWRTVLQMKQAQPYYNPNMASIFELQVRGGQWIVMSDWTDVWTAPASQDSWTRFAFDITYSQNPSVGSIKVYVDLNGDGDAADANEQSPRVSRQTLRPEVAGGSSPVPVGQSIPSHLRAGIYQNKNYSCPSGCSADFDNIQVFKG